MTACGYAPGPCGWQVTTKPGTTHSWRMEDNEGLGTVFRKIQAWALDLDLEVVGYSVRLHEVEGAAPWWEVTGSFRPRPMERNTVWMNPATYNAQLRLGYITYTGPAQTARWNDTYAIVVRDRYPDGVHNMRPA